MENIFDEYVSNLSNEILYELQKQSESWLLILIKNIINYKKNKKNIKELENSFHISNKKLYTKFQKEYLIKNKFVIDILLGKLKYFPHKENNKCSIQKQKSIKNSIKLFELLPEELHVIKFEELHEKLHEELPEELSEKLPKELKIQKITNLCLNSSNSSYFITCNSRRVEHVISIENYVNYIKMCLEDVKNIELVNGNLFIKACSMTACLNKSYLGFKKYAKFMKHHDITNFSELYTNCIIKLAKKNPTQYKILPYDNKINKIKENYVYKISIQCKICVQNYINGKPTYFHALNLTTIPENLHNICGICNFTKEEHKSSLEVCPRPDVIEELNTDTYTTCPGCNTKIELQDGCRKVTCSECTTVFCYTCGKQLKYDKNIGSYYKHTCINGSAAKQNAPDPFTREDDIEGIEAIRAVTVLSLIEHDINPYRDHIFLLKNNN